MKWFKHDTDASNDPKIKKLKKKFGMIGYGVYFNLLEIIARKMENNIDEFGFLPEDWDDESLEMEFNMEAKDLFPLFDYMINIGLFERKNDRIYNQKIQERCDDYTARIIRNKEQCPNSVRTVSDKVLLDKNRIDKKKFAIANFPIKKDLKSFRDLRRAEIGKPPMLPRKMSDKQVVAYSAMKLLDYFRDKVMEIHRKSYLQRKEDKNSQIRNQAKSCIKRFITKEKCEEYINWFLNNPDNEWTKYEPTHCFSNKMYQLFENKDTVKRQDRWY
jgi:hypothetical protein